MASYNFLRDTGTVVVDTSLTQSEVISEMQSIPGWDDMVVAPETPTGALVVAETLRRDNIARNNALLANQINPDLATGGFLDALCGLTLMERRAASKAVAHLQIKAGADPTGKRYADGMAGTTWEITLAFGSAVEPWLCVARCEEAGPIELSKNGIDSALDGGQAVDTQFPQSIIIEGEPPESDKALRARRASAMAGGWSLSAESIATAIETLPEVRSAIVLENPTSSPVKFGENSQGADIFLAPHSILPILDWFGDIAQLITNPDFTTALEKAVFGRKPAGTQFTTWPWNELYIPWLRLPDYVPSVQNVGFPNPIEWGVFLAEPFPIELRIFVKGKGLDIAIVKNLITLALKGTETWQGVRMGEDFYCFELSAAMNELNPSINVVRLEVTPKGLSMWDVGISVQKFKKVSLADSDITVTII